MTYDEYNAWLKKLLIKNGWEYSYEFTRQNFKKDGYLITRRTMDNRYYISYVPSHGDRMVLSLSAKDERMLGITLMYLGRRRLMLEDFNVFQTQISDDPYMGLNKFESVFSDEFPNQYYDTRTSQLMLEDLVKKLI